MSDRKLQLRIEELERKLEESQQLIEALASGEVDAVARRGSLTPVLLHAAQENLRANEQLLRAVFDGAVDAMLIADHEGRCVHANRATGALLGVEREGIVGRRISDFAEVPAHHALDWERLLLEGQLETQFRLVRPDGGVRDTELRAIAPILPGLSLFVLRDVTERRRVELRFQTMFERSHEGVCLVNRAGKVIYSSPGLDRMLGSSAPLAEDADGFELVHPYDREQMRATFAAIVADPGAEVSASYRLQLLDGSTRWREATFRNFLDEPAIAAVVANIRDVTDRRAARATLEQTQRSLEEAQAIAHVGSWALTPSASATISWSAECARIFGRDLDAPPTMEEFVAMVHPDDRAAVDAARAESIARDEILSSEHRIVLPDGQVRWVHTRTRRESTPSTRASASREGAAGAASYRAVGAVQDITDRRQADEARRRLASIVASSDDAIVSCDTDGIIQSWNGGAERLTLYSAAEAIGQPIAMLYAPEESARRASSRRGVDEGQRLEQHEMYALRKDGSPVEVSVTASMLLDETGRNQGTSIIARDVSLRRKTEAALRRTEDQLRQAQKMEAIGSLAGGIAHDFNNILSVILSYAELLMREKMPGDPMHDDIAEISKAGKRAAELTRQLLLFSRQQALVPKVIDPNELIAGMERMLQRLLGAQVNLVWLPAEHAKRVRVDPGSFEQLIMNLVVNARDAMPSGGTLTIATSNVELDEAYAAERHGVTPGSYLQLSVTDTGVGMDEATLGRIYEPFFTTKGKGKGTGLGLATVFGIVQQSGGNLAVTSAPGRGTTFQVHFPRVTASLDSLLPEPSPKGLRGTEAILLVEDEEQVRSIMLNILRRYGYRVVTAQSAGEALLICENRENVFDLLLTDIVMPQMSGPALAKRLAALRPAMKVLCMSGYTDDNETLRGVLASGTAFLQKPITPTSLATKVREVLDGPLSPHTNEE